MSNTEKLHWWQQKHLLAAAVIAVAAVSGIIFYQVKAAHNADLQLQDSTDLKSTQQDSLEEKMFFDETYNPKNLRSCLDTFMFYMLRGSFGQPRQFLNAVKFLEPPKNDTSQEELTEKLAAANKMISLLRFYSFDYKNIPQFLDGGKAEFTIGEEEDHFTIHMNYDPEIGWRFAAEDLYGEAFDQKYLQITNYLAKTVLFDNDAGGFDNNYYSPYQTMLVFSTGAMKGSPRYSIRDAVKALDLSDYHPLIRNTIGKPAAIMIFRLLQYKSQGLLLTNFSDDPNYDQSPVLLDDPALGFVLLHQVKDKVSGQKSWKISIDNLEMLSYVYDRAMREGMAKKLDYFQPSRMQLSLFLDDLCQLYCPQLEDRLLGVNIWKWILLAILLVTTRYICKLFRMIAIPLINTLVRFAGLEESQNFDQRLLLPLEIVLVSQLWLFGIVILIWSPPLLLICMYAQQIIFTITLTWALLLVIDLVKHGVELHLPNSYRILIEMVMYFFKTLIIVFALTRLAGLLGSDANQIFAALGISGIAVAFASKETISNIFGSLTLMTDRPFRVGDRIIIGKDIDGIVEHVGLRSTRLRTFEDSLITVPNSIFISSSVNNMGMRNWRRYQTTLGIRQDTPVEKINAFVAGIREIVAAESRFKPDRRRVYVKELNTYSISIMIDLFVRIQSYEEMLEITENFVKKCLTLARQLGVNYALPTQTLTFTEVKEPDYSRYPNNDGVALAQAIDKKYQEKESPIQPPTAEESAEDPESLNADKDDNLMGFDDPQDAENIKKRIRRNE